MTDMPVTRRKAICGLSGLGAQAMEMPSSAAVRSVLPGYRHRVRNRHSHIKKHGFPYCLSLLNIFRESLPENQLVRLKSFATSMFSGCGKRYRQAIRRSYLGRGVEIPHEVINGARFLSRQHRAGVPLNTHPASCQDIDASTDRSCSARSDR